MYGRTKNMWARRGTNFAEKFHATEDDSEFKNLRPAAAFFHSCGGIDKFSARALLRHEHKKTALDSRSFPFKNLCLTSGTACGNEMAPAHTAGYKAILGDSCDVSKTSRHVC